MRGSRVESGPAVTGQQVEVIVDRFVAACMFHRGGLSITLSLYTFISERYLVPTPLWDSCRYECRVMKALALCLYTRLDATWSKTVYGSDASGDGF